MKFSFKSGLEIEFSKARRDSNNRPCPFPSSRRHKLGSRPFWNSGKRRVVVFTLQLTKKPSYLLRYVLNDNFQFPCIHIITLLILHLKRNATNMKISSWVEAWKQPLCVCRCYKKDWTRVCDVKLASCIVPSPTHLEKDQAIVSHPWLATPTQPPLPKMVYLESACVRQVDEISWKIKLR